ncbi:MAG TPA: 26S protease regulatory subunit [Desulfarculaceae bacterium]|nr:26S protease regulatory subunit [Desulfarculaceae bacterium]
MEKIILEIDLGEKFSDARRFKRDHAEMTLDDFLKVFPARFAAGALPGAEIMELNLAEIVFQPIAISEAACEPENGTTCGLRRNLDQLWQEDTVAPDQEVSAPVDSLDNFPAAITDNEAVRLAYRQEMDSIADYLKHGLSVLVICDKVLTEFLYEFVCHQAGRRPVLDAALPEEMRPGLAGELDRALDGGYSNLPVLLRNLKADEVLVLRSLDLLNEAATTETLYERTVTREKPQLLAFLDPSLEVRKVLSDRFAVHIQITGLPRFLTSAADNDRQFTVSRLLTRQERRSFAGFDPENLYKNVSGLNAIQFRNAMRYVGAKVAENTPASEIYREIREFKITSGSEVEVPDTTFADIGGYEAVKKQLRHVISLISGDIKGVSDEQRIKLLPRGFIFHGPPGTGKTLFAKAVANELNATIQMISGPEIMDKYVGQSENNLRQVFATARRNAPAVIFFDEFDSIASQRSVYADGGARANNAVVAQLLTEMDGFRRDQAVLVIGTSNRIDIIDEALLRPSRLRPVEIGLPDVAARRQVARIHAASFGIDDYLKKFFAIVEKKPQGKLWQEQDLKEFFTALDGPDSDLQKSPGREGSESEIIAELNNFSSFINDCRLERDPADLALLDELSERVQEMIARLAGGTDYDSEHVTSDPGFNEFDELMTLLVRERSTGLDANGFLETIIDLVALHAEDFNNDEIRAVFQEASLDHHLEGSLLSPRYFGRKVGEIQRRRQERTHVHL